MPVLPDVASRIRRSLVSLCVRKPSQTIRRAARSFTEPPGFFHSALAKSVTPGTSRSIRESWIRGVFPTRSRSEAICPTEGVQVYPFLYDSGSHAGLHRGETV